MPAGAAGPAGAAQPAAPGRWPSLGWTTTKPGPKKPSWKASPEPRPMRAPAVKVLLICGWRFADDAHEVAALVGQGLLDHAAQAPGALVGEVDIALVGDHRSLRGDHLGAHDHPEHLRGLEGPALGGLLLLKRLVEDGAAHGEAFPIWVENKRMVQGRSSRWNGEGIPLRGRAVSSRRSQRPPPAPSRALCTRECSSHHHFRVQNAHLGEEGSMGLRVRGAP